MSRLENRTKNQILIPQLEIATGFVARGKGLLGRSGLPRIRRYGFIIVTAFILSLCNLQSIAFSLIET